MKYILQVTKATREQDLIIPIEAQDRTEALFKLGTILLNPVNPAYQANDGYRLIQVPHGGGNEVESIQGIAQVQYETATEFNTVSFDTYDEAAIFIEALDDSDGYILIDEFEGRSTVLEASPSLWITELNTPITQVANGHGRTEADRI